MYGFGLCQLKIMSPKIISTLVTQKRICHFEACAPHRKSEVFYIKVKIKCPKYFVTKLKLAWTSIPCRHFAVKLRFFYKGLMYLDLRRVMFHISLQKVWLLHSINLLVDHCIFYLQSFMVQHNMDFHMLFLTVK